jgi:hypothetical protein
MVWAAQQPLDMRVFGVDYSDTELLGRGRPAVGWTLHAANGAVFGVLYALVAERLPGPPVVRGVTAALAEHTATWPLTRFVKRWRLYGSRRAYWQAFWRHALFGALLGLFAARLDSIPAPE